jgi:ABC-type Fe3+/spermidine/putrescine transport system ATPase subunit
MKSAVALKNLFKVFVSPVDPEETRVAVDGVTLEVSEGEFLAMVGPTGCGKSTILRMIAGLERPTGGEIFVDGRRINDTPPKARNIGFLSQGYALFRRMTVLENICFGLKTRKVPGKERKWRAEEMISLMDLEGLEAHRPDQLSGGQKQRVALARALAPWPRVLLMDEPFGALDVEVRQRLKVDTKRWQRELKIPTILVTHDQREAMELGDRVAIMNDGRFEQVDTSQVIHSRPANQFVARFMGRAIGLSAGLDRGLSELVETKVFDILLGPEDFSLVARDNRQGPQGGNISGTVVSQSFLGFVVRVELELGNGRPVTLALPKNRLPVNGFSLGSPVSLALGSLPVLPSQAGAASGSNESHQETRLVIEA